MAVKTSVVNELSFDVAAELASAGAAPPAPTDQVADDEPDADAEPADVPSFFDNADDSDEDATGTQDSDDQDESDDEGNYLDVAADGRTHRVDLRNKEELRKQISAGLGVKRAFSDLAKQKQENKRLVQELKSASSRQEKAELFEKLEQVKDDENELYRIVTGGKSLEDVIKARVERQLKWADADPAERAEIEREEREKTLLSRIERMETSARVEKEQATKERERAEEKAAYSTAYPEYQAILRSLKVTDKAQRKEVATDLWELGWARIARLVAANDAERQADPSTPALALTSELVRTQFQSVAARWGHASKAKSKETVTKIIDKKSKEASKKAGIAATRNYRSSTSEFSDLQDLSPTKIFAKLQNRLKKSKG